MHVDIENIAWVGEGLEFKTMAFKLHGGNELVVSWYLEVMKQLLSCAKLAQDEGTASTILRVLRESPGRLLE